jgi:hypothetical protein
VAGRPLCNFFFLKKKNLGIFVVSKLKENEWNGWNGMGPMKAQAQTDL